MRVATYSRVSTDEQAKDGYSLLAQQKRMRAFARSKGWEIIGEYVEQGQSGRTIERPEYLRMMDESEGWDLLLIWKLDRIHRDSVNFARMMEAMKKAGKEFCSIWESFDTTTAYGRFAMDVIMRIAQLESETIGERVKLGMTQKARKGGHPGMAPFGYVNEDKQLIVHPEQSEAVRWMYSMRCRGYSYERIAYNLNLKGTTTKKGNPWTSDSCRAVIMNPTYAGFVRWDGIIAEGRHAPIVSPEIWESLNGPLRTNNRTAYAEHPGRIAGRAPRFSSDDRRRQYIRITDSYNLKKEARNVTSVPEPMATRKVRGRDTITGLRPLMII